MPTTRPWSRLAGALALGCGALAPGAWAQEPDAPAPPPPARLERFLPATTQLAVSIEEPATLLKQLEEKTTADAALAALGVPPADAEGFHAFRGQTPVALLARTAQTLLGTTSGRETLERLPYPVALAITGFALRPFDFAGEGLASADILLLIETRDAEVAAKLAREMGERCERAGLTAREAEFRDVAIRCFDERVTVPKRRQFRFPHQGPGEEAPPGGGEGGDLGPAEPVAQDDGAGEEATTRVVTRAICHVGTLLAVAPSEDAARQLIQRVKDEESPDRLTEQAEYRRGTAPLGDGGAIRTYAHLAGFAGDPKAAEAGPFGNMLAEFGKTIPTRAMAMRLREDGLTCATYAVFAPGADASRLGPVVLLAAGVAEPMPEPVMVPDGADEVSICRVGWKGFWDMVTQNFARMGGGEFEAQMEERMGFHPYRDILSALGDVVVRWTRTGTQRVPAGEDGEGGEMVEMEASIAVTCAAVREEARLLATFGKLADRPQGGVERKEFEGRTIFLNKAAGGVGMGGMFGAGGQGSAVCVTGGYLVEADGGEDDLRAAVARLKSEGSPFFADDAWKPLKSELGDHLSWLSYARRGKERLAFGDAPPAAGDDLQMFGISLDFGDDLVTEHCDRAVQGIARAEDGLRTVTAGRWAPKAK